MRVIILAAGESKRLRPLTENFHKSLLPVAGRTILDRQLDILRPHKPELIVIVVGFEKERVKEHVLSEHADLPFVFVENPDFKTTSAAYSLWLAREHLKGPCLYMNGDLVCDPEIVQQVVESEYDTVTAIHKNLWDEEQVNVIHDENGQILEIGKHIGREKSHGEFLGITKFGAEFSEKLREVLEQFVTEGKQKGYAVDAINETIQKGAVKFALDVTHLRAIEIDTAEDLKRAEEMWQ